MLITFLALLIYVLQQLILWPPLTPEHRKLTTVDSALLRQLMLTKPITRDMHSNGGHLNCKSFSEYNEHLIPMLKGYIHTYIPWIHKCVIKRVGRGISHNTYAYIYSVKYHKHFTKLLYIIFTFEKLI
jgi:hypothetical protein